MQLGFGFIIAVLALVCIAAGRLLTRIRSDFSGKLFFVLGGFFLAVDVPLVGSRIFWLAPLAVVGGLLIGNYYIRRRGLR